MNAEKLVAVLLELEYPSPSGRCPQCGSHSIDKSGGRACCNNCGKKFSLTPGGSDPFARKIIQQPIRPKAMTIGFGDASFPVGGGGQG